MADHTLFTAKFITDWSIPISQQSLLLTTTLLLTQLLHYGINSVFVKEVLVVSSWAFLFDKFFWHCVEHKYTACRGYRQTRGLGYNLPEFANNYKQIKSSTSIIMPLASYNSQLTATVEIVDGITSSPWVADQKGGSICTKIDGISFNDSYHD